MEAKAQLRYLRVTPRKARRVVNEIRGKSVVDAENLLRFAPQSVARDVRKLLNSAVANAEYLADEYGESLQPADLKIVETYVDEGPTMKRFRPRAQGRAGQILKRTSHVTIVVGTDEDEEEGDH